MNIRTPGRVAAALLLVLLPVVCFGGRAIAPDFYQYYSIYNGWQNNQTAWFICTSASSIRFADSTYFATIWNPWFPEKPVLAPRLQDALAVTPSVARPMYLVLNSDQGPVFDTAPGNSDYSGLWQVYLIRFNQDAVRPVTNTSSSDPHGLPSTSEGEIIETDTVINAPIVATGQLGGPAYPAPPGCYRIKQAAFWALDTIPKSVMLPVYYTYITNPLTGRPVVGAVGVTDAQTQELADMFRANLAPGLAGFPDASLDDLWLMKSLCPQLPVLKEAPAWRAGTFNPDYCPVARYSLLGRSIPPSSVINNPTQLQMLLNKGLLFELAGGPRININVVQIH